MAENENPGDERTSTRKYASMSPGERTARTRLVVLGRIESRTPGQEREYQRLKARFDDLAEGRGTGEPMTREQRRRYDKAFDSGNRTRNLPRVLEFERELIENYFSRPGALPKTATNVARFLDNLDQAIDDPQGYHGRTGILRDAKYQQTAQKLFGSRIADMNSAIDVIMQRRAMDPHDRAVELGYPAPRTARIPGTLPAPDAPGFNPEQAGMGAGDARDFDRRTQDRLQRLGTPGEAYTRHLPLRQPERQVQQGIPNRFMRELENPTINIPEEVLQEQPARYSLRVADEIINEAHDPSVRGLEGDIGSRLREEALARTRADDVSVADAFRASRNALMNSPEASSVLEDIQLRAIERYGLDPARVKIARTFSELPGSPQEANNLGFVLSKQDVYEAPEFKNALSAAKNRSAQNAKNRMLSLGTTPRQSGTGPDLPAFDDPDRDYRTRGDIAGPREFESPKPGTPQSRRLTQESLSRWQNEGIADLVTRAQDALKAGNFEQAQALLSRYDDLMERLDRVSAEGDQELLSTITNQEQTRGPGSSGRSLMQNYEPIMGRVNPSGYDTNAEALLFQELMSRIEDQSGLAGNAIDTGSGIDETRIPRVMMRRPDDPAIIPYNSQGMSAPWQDEWAAVQAQMRPTDFYENEGALPVRASRDTPEWDINDPTSRPATPPRGGRLETRAGPPHPSFGRSGLPPDYRMPPMPDAPAHGILESTPLQAFPVPPERATPSPNFNPEGVPQLPPRQASGPVSNQFLANAPDPGGFTPNMIPGFGLPDPVQDTLPRPLGTGWSGPFGMPSVNPVLDTITKLGQKTLPTIGKGLDALGLVGNVFDVAEMDEFNRYIADQNAQGGSTLPDGSQMMMDPAAAGQLSALSSSIPLLGNLIFDRRKFMNDPAYRQRFQHDPGKSYWWGDQTPVPAVPA